jgi:tetraacyldisaccharide 4'-kinase
VARGLARADALVVLGEDRAGSARRAGTLPVLHARLEPDGEVACELAGRALLAFAGIGRPEKFFATLESLGARLADRVAFPDHHPFRPEDIAMLLERAERLGALPVTTAKDAVRLPPDARARVRVLPVRAVWQDAGALDALLDRLRLQGGGHG